MLLVTVSVAVIVRLPTETNVAPFEKEWTPPSLPLNV
jgi:hypothetical protein